MAVRQTERRWTGTRMCLLSRVDIGEFVMKRIKILKNVKRDRRGASLVEYSLLLGLVALAAVGLIQGVGGSINSIWTTTDSQMNNAASTYSGGTGG